jgi:hypothetical protein
MSDRGPFVMSRYISSKGLIEAMQARIRELEGVLTKYKSCRHGCVECFCTKEAREVMAMAPDARVDEGAK